MSRAQKRRIVSCARACVRALERADFWAFHGSPVLESGSRGDAAVWAGAAFSIVQENADAARLEALRLSFQPGAAA